MSRSSHYLQTANFSLRQGSLRIVLFLVLSALCTSALVRSASTVSAAPLLQSQTYASGLILSEYIDGPANDKAIEIYNGTESIITLAGYELEVYDGTANNSGTPLTLVLSTQRTSIGVGEALVIVNSNATPSMRVSGAILWDDLIFDGDDAIILRNAHNSGNNVVDSIGQLERPGPWSGNGVSTVGQGLRRKPAVCGGRWDATEPFDPSLQWLAYSNTNYTNLGIHTMNCAAALTNAPVINEFVFNHVGGGDPEYIEVKVPTNAPFSSYWALVINGNAGTNVGLVEHNFEVSQMAMTNGLYRTAYSRFNDGTNTILLVNDYFGSVGQDIDTNNDGIIDNWLWTGPIVDYVAVSQGNTGDTTYARGIVLKPFYDGKPNMPGGASRFPDNPGTVQNTHSITAWTRNNFNGDGLGCSGCDNWTPTDEAVNTPGQPNRTGGGAQATGTVTVTPTPTITRTPGPLPDNCVDIIVNGGFEQNHVGWKSGDDPVAPRFTGDQRTEGLRSVLLGNPPDPGSRNVASFSSIRQLVEVPKSASIAYITWDHLSQTQEPVTTDPGSQSDRQDMIVLATNQMPLAIEYRARLNQTNWTGEREDLTNFIGKSFYVYFNVYNDGNGLRTWMYLDNVQLIVCYPEGVQPGGNAWMPTPMPLASSTPTPTFTPFIAPTSTETATATPTATETAVPSITDLKKALTEDAAEDTDKSSNGETTPADGNGLDEETSTEEASTEEASTEGGLADNSGTPSGSLGPADAATAGKNGLECVELVRNGGFEQQGLVWSIGDDGGRSDYTLYPTYDGSLRAMAISNLEAPNIPEISVITQTIKLTGTYDTYTLDFRYYPITDGDPGPGDLQYVDIYSLTSGQFEQRVLSTKRNEERWSHGQSDLTYLAGDEITLYFAVNNDGVSGRSAMFVDNVSVLACRPASTDGAEGQTETEGADSGTLSTSEADAGSRSGPDAGDDASAGSDQASQSGRREWQQAVDLLAVLAGILVVIGLLVWGIVYSLRSDDGRVTSSRAQSPRSEPAQMPESEPETAADDSPNEEDALSDASDSTGSPHD